MFNIDLLVDYGASNGIPYLHINGNDIMWIFREYSQYIAYFKALSGSYLIIRTVLHIANQLPHILDGTANIFGGASDAT